MSTNKNAILDNLNTINTNLINAGAYTYYNDRIPPEIHDDHKFVLSTLMTLAKQQQDQFVGFHSLSYFADTSVTDADAQTYNNNVIAISGLVSIIGQTIGARKGLEGAKGRIFYVDEYGKIVYDSNVDNNTLLNARAGTINTNNLANRSYIIAANLSGTHFGHAIRMSPTSRKRTVYVARADSAIGFDEYMIVYAVYWPGVDQPEFLL